MKQQNLQTKKDNKVNTVYEDILHKSDLKITRNRMEVLRLFYNSNKPITHNYVMEHLPEAENWDRVTIYRTLSEFAEKKIIRQLISNDRVSYFELIKDESSHGHFVCDICGKIECLKSDSLKVEITKQNFKYQIFSFEVLAHGKCGECI